MKQNTRFPFMIPYFSQEMFNFKKRQSLVLTKIKIYFYAKFSFPKLAVLTYGLNFKRELKNCPQKNGKFCNKLNTQPSPFGI